jgi:hypothetical protein
MRADFFRGDDPETVVGTGRWNGRSAEVSSADDDVRASLARLFRATPVVVDEPSLRPSGSVGEVVVQPGSLEWFRLAALARAEAAGLRVRLVPEVTSRSGWDPASAYRTFRQVVTLLESPVTPVDEPVPEAAKPV